MANADDAVTANDRNDLNDPHDRFPKGFFSRVDETEDTVFYQPDRFVTHIDDQAIAAVSALYAELGLAGSVLDLMSSWISHFPARPEELVVLGMNRRDLEANEMAHEVVLHDLNRDPSLPFASGRFDAVTCCVSIDYLVRPIDVLAEARRVARPGSPIVCTFSNRCFPTKAIRGWLSVDERTRCEVVAEYMRLAGLDDISWQCRTPTNHVGDPLYAVVGHAV
jgi:SAM-dependent methyltransferase